MAKHKRKKKKKTGCAVLAVLGGLILFGLAVAIPYQLFVGSSKYINTTASPTPEIISTAPPIPTHTATHSSSKSGVNTTPTPTTSSRPNKKTDSPQKSEAPEKYETYENELYGFSCDYPENFTEYVGNGGNEVFSVCSPDGNVSENIFVNEAPEETPAMNMRSFLSSHPQARIVENYASEKYFYVLIQNDSTYIYRYAAYTDGAEIGFEFSYPEGSKYENYPEIIRDSFSY